MARYHTKSNGNVPFTSEEEAERDVEELAGSKEAKIDELNAAYGAAIHADIVHNTKTYTADEDKLNVISRFSSLNSVPVGMYMEAKDGEQVAMNLVELRALGSAIAARGLAEHQNLTTKKAAVNAATTQARINAVIY